VLEAIDRQDLYGSVAYPKQHQRSQVPALYRWAARRRGLFVNPALTEPFGLTLLEAAACGLPVVATDDGGPRDILARCRNGLLAAVAERGRLAQVLEQAAAPSAPWDDWQCHGLEAVAASYSWQAHAGRYLRVAADLCGSGGRPADLERSRPRLMAPSRLRKVYASGQQGQGAVPSHGPRFWLSE